MRQPFFRGIANQLVLWALINALALALLVAIVWLAYGRIESLSSEIAEKQVRQVIDNAALGRELSATLAALDRVTRSCEEQPALHEAGPLDKRLADLARTAADLALAEATSELAATARRLLARCSNIGARMDAVARTDAFLLDQIAMLERLTSRALIDQTLAGKDTGYLDQVMALTTGYRESIMLISRAIGAGLSAAETAQTGAGTALSQVEDLQLRLKTLTAATPEMAGIARKMVGAVMRYRAEILALQAAREDFAAAQQESAARHGKVLMHLQRLDRETDQRANGFLADLHTIVAQTAERVLWTGVAITLISLLLAIWFVRHSIRRPLGGILQQIAHIRGGSAAPAPTPAPRDDEWGAIQSALTDLASNLTQAHGLLREVIDTAPVRVFWKDRECRYLGCNPVFARDAGKASPAELIGRDDYAMGWAAQADLYRTDDKRVMESGQSRLNYEEPQTTPDGKTIWLRTSKVPLRDETGKVIGVLGLYDDITALKQTEAELERHRLHLEELVQDRTVELTKAKVAAESANRAKSAFLANMSHELRTPMNGVMGMIDMAKRRMIDPKGLDQLDKAKLSAERLLSVVNDILDISKIEADRLVFEKVPLQLFAVIDNLVSVLGKQATDKGLGLKVDIPSDLLHMHLQGDPLRLGQILMNLVGNAIKFTEKGAVTLRARSVGETPEAVQVRFEVSDTGIGIDADAQTRLFQSFEQADNSMTRKYGGTGLGLAICKLLVQLMGGEIGVESTPGNGSTFWFAVPLKKREQSAASPAPSSVAQTAEQRLQIEFAGTRVLLAEDEPVTQEISRGLLEDAGLAVEIAENGRQALELARQKRYALILMDMQMPILNGLDATKAIRADSLNQTTPILAMTANAFDEDRDACLAVGMNDHISKPVNPERLFETLLAWLDEHPRGSR